MRQLTGLDNAFLTMETATTFGHISSLSIYEPPTDGSRPIDLLRDQISARLGVLTPFRRRLVEVPFDLDRPWWIEDPNFDLDFHLRHVAVPAPGGNAELSSLVAQIIARPLDRTRPLWEGYVIDGVSDNRWALLLKIHHAAVDGAAGAELTTSLLSPEPTTEVPDLPPPPQPEEVPTPVEMLQRSTMSWFRRPRAMAEANIRFWTELAGRNLAVKERPTFNKDLTPTGLAPPTPFNKSITAQRRFAFGTHSLTKVKAIKSAYEVTVNDVVMAACAGGLRRYLLEKDALPDRPLIAGIPVSIRTGDEADPWTNRVSALSAPIPTHIEDRIERLHFMRDAMEQAKGTFQLVPAEALQNFAEFPAPAVFTQAATTMTRARLADRVEQPTNLIVSNVPGPRHPLYLGTARLSHYYPVSTIAEGQGLNITVQSLEDKLDFGLVADRELVPDLDLLLEYLLEEVDALAALVEPESGLDPAAQAVLDITAAAIANGAPPMWEQTPVEARTTYETMASMLGTGDDIHSVEDRSIPGPGGDLAVRIYRPAEGNLPAVVYYHGGGFVIGSLDTHDRECRRLAARSGAVVVSVDYRLAPEHRFPAAVDDAWAALTWVRDNAEELDIDPERLVVAGDSAGGNLAAVTALRARDEGIPLALQALIYPAVDISEKVDERYPSRRANDGLVLSESLNRWFITAYVGEDGVPDDPRLTPINEKLSDSAPALVITAEFDPLRDEGTAYAEALEAAGVPVTHSDYPGQIHGFFNLGPAIPAGWDAVHEVAAAITMATQAG